MQQTDFSRLFQPMLSSVTRQTDFTRLFQPMLSSVTWQTDFTRLFQPMLSSVTWQTDFTRLFQAVMSPAWEDVVYRTLHKLETLGEVEDSELSTWWLDLPLKVRVATIAIFVWICALVSLAAQSLAHPDQAAILRDATGLNPAYVATAIAGFASFVYKHFARPDKL
jgi:hypothetical protein